MQMNFLRKVAERMGVPVSELADRREVKGMEKEQDASKKKNPHPWRTWILLLAIIQILTVFQIWQMNQKVWKALVHQSQDVIQLGDRLSDHLRNEKRHAEAMNQLLEKENRLLEECNQKLETFLNQVPTDGR